MDRHIGIWIAGHLEHAWPDLRLDVGLAIATPHPCYYGQQALKYGRLGAESPDRVTGSLLDTPFGRLDKWQLGGAKGLVKK